MKLAERKNWVKKLKPYWKTRQRLFGEFRKVEMDIERAIKEELGEELEFFYVDGECVGMGHSDYDRRKRKKKNYFPLIHDHELSGDLC